MTNYRVILKVAVPSPLYKTFDYLPLPASDTRIIEEGMRVRVPFGRTRTVGVVMALSTHTDVPANKLKSILEVLDYPPLLSRELLQLACWASNYYHHPIGEVVASLMPPAFRRGETTRVKGEPSWHVTEQGLTIDTQELQKAPLQKKLLEMAKIQPEGLKSTDFRQFQGDWRTTMRTLIKKGWFEKNENPSSDSNNPVIFQNFRLNEDNKESRLQLNHAQQQAVSIIDAASEGFQSFLLDGVTGSGKTEVYLRVIENVIEQHRQALVLVPEIGLTPQLVTRFENRFNVPLAILHSGLSNKARGLAWLMARSGQAPIVIGTRSAVFTPLKTPGVIIIDEEHDISFKQQEGFRYSARDLAVIRAKTCNIPVVLGSATPCLESLFNVQAGRYKHIVLPNRAGSATQPIVHVLDIRGQRLTQSISPQLLKEVELHMARGGQVLLFLNRRGFAPTLLCHDCGWVADCSQCDARLTLHLKDNVLRCHHCGSQRPIDTHCPKCKSVQLASIGKGTERLDQALSERFPTAGVIRIDRDTTRHKGSLESLLDAVEKGEHKLLVGTQMLAKGHHFPNITLVGIIDVDQGFFSADFRASERMAQLILQVAGRSGRTDRQGHVIIQTHQPEHPLLCLLLSKGYQAFATTVLKEREDAGWPPYSHLALLRAEAVQPDMATQFLELVRDLAVSMSNYPVDILGPVPAPMLRRAGKYRCQLLLQASQRRDLHALLSQLTPELPTIKLARKVRWSLDVDPQELY